MDRYPIAIIGIGCRFPSAKDPAAFWQLLRNEVDAITKMPADRWGGKAFYDPNPTTPDTMNTHWGGFLEQVDQFDPQFFGIAPREAVSMDPQQRLLLEVTWEALEDAGQVPRELAGKRVGVFIGISGGDYARPVYENPIYYTYATTGIARSIAANRISYCFDFQGPSMAVDTACSASLVAVHLACQSLWTGEAALALAGGANFILSPKVIASLSKPGFISPDGRCKTFDAQANGYVRGEGAGTVLLKPLSQALADNDSIYAVIRGSAVSQDGHSNGLTAPNRWAQEAVLKEAYRQADVSPGQVRYVEAYDTGTILGDPIEMKALGTVLATGRAPNRYCSVGSVKTNIGHLEAAAGIAGLIKVALALKHRQIPASLHFREPNPYIPFDKLPLRVQQTLGPWPEGTGPILAGVSAFGFGGTNAHVVLEAAPTEFLIDNEIDRPRHLLTLRAKNEAALRNLATRYNTFLASNPTLSNGDLYLPDLCFTANTGRSNFTHRLAVTTESIPQLREQLAAFVAGQQAAELVSGQVEKRKSPRVAFLFTGQGSQYVQMGRELYETQPTFQAIIDQCDELLQEHLNGSLLKILYPETDKEDSNSSSLPSHPIDQTTYTQPALFALEFALATLWQSWGVQPNLLSGHSVGELAAACVAGVFSLEDGLKLVAARGRLMGALPQDGTMVSLLTDEARVQQAIAPYADDVSIAAVNGPKRVVISGKREVVQAIVEQLTAEGIKTRQLIVSHAFHSPLMVPMLDEFRQVAERITYHKPKLRLVSNLTGQLAGDAMTTPDYWVRHIREAVRFADGVATLHQQGIGIFLEVGPKPTLLGLAAQVADSHQPPTDAISYLPSLREDRSSWQQMLLSLGELYVHGVEIDWAGFDKHYQRRKVGLPTYPFQRQRYWVEPKARRGSETLGPLIDKMIKSPAIKETLFETILSTDTLPLLQDYHIYGTIVAPSACHLAMVLSAAELAFGSQMVQLNDVIFPQALTIADDGTRTAQVIFTPSDVNGTRPQSRFQLISFEGTSDDTDVASTHATGTIGGSGQALAATSLNTLQARCTKPIDNALDALDLPLYLGPSFRWIDKVWCTPDQLSTTVETPREILAKLRRPEAVDSLVGYLLHPGLLDACFQASAVAYQLSTDTEALYLLFSLQRLLLHQPANGDEWWCHIEPIDELKWNLRLFDHAGQIITEIDGFELRAVSPAAIQTSQLRTDWLYTLDWQAQPLIDQLEPTQPPDCWLIVGAADQWRASLVRYLEAKDSPVFVATEAVRQVVAEIADQYLSVGVIYLGLEDERTRTAPIPEMTLQLCDGLLQLSQALIDTALSVHLWVVTQGSQSVAERLPLRSAPSLHDQGNSYSFTPAAGALWGLGRTLSQEQPRLHCVCLDLDPDQKIEKQIQVLHQELLTSLDKEPPATQVAYRNQTRYLAHLEQWQAPSAIDKTHPMRLQLRDYGALEHLTWGPLRRRHPAPGEIEVEVKVAGLNFRDVLNSLGLLKAYYAQALGITRAQDVGLGFECAGLVSAVGDGVTQFAVGDRVMGLGSAAGTFASYINVPASQMTAIPDHLSDAQAATIPLTFLTAWYGLVELANLQPGERLLIHAAAGGVGQAAVQIAQMLGAEIIATASPGKWDFLHQQGVAQVFNSRTLDFAPKTLQQTDNRGVDVVFNSLKDDFIHHSFATLAAHGRFLEIGKIGIWSPEQAAHHRPDVAYYPYDLGEAIAQEPALLSRLWQTIKSQFISGRLQPLPHTTFPAQQSRQAFRYMQQAKQVGKVVITFEPPQPLRLHTNATYLITGGVGALGMQVAQQLVDDGATHLVLTSRRGVTTELQRQALAQLTQTGADIQVIKADVAHYDQVQYLLSLCEAIAPLRGIVHTAGVLDDGVVTEQTRDRFATVLSPKVDGSWHLHTLTQQMALDFFVCFSSAAALLGAPGQSSYAAANAFMDALMQQRHQQGLPGLSLNWGPWAEVGMAAHLQDRLQAQGIAMIAPQQGRRLFQHLLQQPLSQVGILPLQRTRPAQHPLTQRSNMLEILTALPLDDRHTRLDAYLRTEIAAVLGLNSPTQLEARTRLFDLGLDSLMAVELKNKLESELACTLRATLLFDYPTLELLIPYLLDDCLGLASHQPTPPSIANAVSIHNQEQNHPIITDPTLETLSEADLDALLEQELGLLEDE